MQRCVLAGLLLVLAACDDGRSTDAVDAAVPASDAASEPELASGRPDGVALCYSETSSTHPATTAFWAALRGGQLEDRATVIADLKVATEMYPGEEELALLSGLANLWRVAEPLPSQLDDTAGFIAAALSARSELTRAYALCPTDHRIAAWLGPVLVNAGRATNDQTSVDEGLAVLQRGIEAYPSFVLFSKLLVYADLPKTDPDFQLALQAIEQNRQECNAGDPACLNQAHVAHNVEGARVFMGDAYAKAGDESQARRSYQSAMDAAEYGDWDYQALLADRISTLEARIAAFDTPASDDDPASAWNDVQQCSICHRQ